MSQELFHNWVYNGDQHTEKVEFILQQSLVWGGGYRQKPEGRNQSPIVCYYNHKEENKLDDVGTMGWVVKGGLSEELTVPLGAWETVALFLTEAVPYRRKALSVLGKASAGVDSSEEGGAWSECQ